MLARAITLHRAPLLVRQVVQATEHSLPIPAQQRTVWSDAPGEEERRERDSFYDDTIEEYAQQPVVQLTLRHMMELGQSAWLDQSRLIYSAEFVREELPKRLARRLMDLQLLPYIVVTNPNIKQVYDCYYHAFNALRTFPPIKSLSDNEHFSQVLRRLVDEHAPMLDYLASGLRECRRKPVVGQQLALDSFLDNMLRSRISRRVLAEQHINLHNGRAGYIGVVALDLHIADSVDLAAGRCRQVCIETYGVAPDVIVSGDTSLTMPYIPAHLDYMLYELLKNSARAVVERDLKQQQQQQRGGAARPVGGGGSSGRWGHRLPPILVRICNSEEQVTIRISDQGGGIPKEDVEQVWQYGFTTTDASPRASGGASGEGLGMDNQPPSAVSSLPLGMEAAGGGAGLRRWRMAGLGFGLPLSRLYARYFGGDLSFVNMAGYGVDAFLTLQRLDSDWQETDSAVGVEPLVNTSAGVTEAAAGVVQ